MRELKFRAFDKVTKRYYAVSGLEFGENGELCEVYLAGIEIDESNPTANVRKPSDVVLEQGTGLKDKNGKEIYEGDIVRAFEHNYEVKFCEMEDSDCSYFYQGWGYGNSSLYEEHDFVEVIGKIHENGDLLNVD